MARSKYTETGEKICTRCSKHFPNTEEYFYSSGNTLRGDCKECCKLRKKEWYYSTQPDRQEYSRDWYANNKERAKEANRAWQQNNKDRANQIKASYRERNKERVLESNRKWQRNNPDTLRAQDAVRRSRKMGAEGFFKPKDIRKIYETQQGLCYYCSNPVAWKDKHIEHMIPLSRGGSNWPSNIVVSCEFCNYSKHDKTPEEFEVYRNGL